MNKKKLEVLLIRHPTTFTAGTIAEGVQIPIGLLSIASYAEKKGLPVEVYDANIEFNLDELKKSSERYLIGASWQDVEKRISNKNYDVVGISNMFYAQFPDAIQTARIVKKVLPESLLVIGGPHSSVAGEEILREFPEIDIAAAGEGEITFSEILEWKLGMRDIASIRGISYRKNGQIITNQRQELINNLDEFPMPAYHLVDIKKYFKSVEFKKGRWILREHRVFPILTSRGCPYDCVFCTIHLHMGRRMRYHGVPYVLNHMKYVIDNFAVQHFRFNDDNVSMDRDRFIGILKGIIDLNKSGYHIVWQTPNGIRVDTLGEETLKLAKESGLKSIILSVESGDQRVIDHVIHKNLSLEKVLEVASLCKKLKIKAKAGFMMGLPGETTESFKNTIQFAKMLLDEFGIKSSISTATPYKGTKLYDLCVEKNYLTRQMTPEIASRSHQSEGIIQTENFTVEDVKKYRLEFERKSRKSSLFTKSRRLFS
jgi:magnesium-protoporphyrin IX monomethyl ester (oxidative) cyclase